MTIESGGARESDVNREKRGGGRERCQGGGRKSKRCQQRNRESAMSIENARASAIHK